jgi:hypothetical protein
VRVRTLRDESEFRRSRLDWFKRLIGNNVRMARGNHPQIVDGGIMHDLPDIMAYREQRYRLGAEKMANCTVYLKIS